jgi:hypothetical protein
MERHTSYYLEVAGFYGHRLSHSCFVSDPDLDHPRRSYWPHYHSKQLYQSHALPRNRLLQRCLSFFLHIRLPFMVSRQRLRRRPLHLPQRCAQNSRFWQKNLPFPCISFRYGGASRFYFWNDAVPPTCLGVFAFRFSMRFWTFFVWVMLVVARAGGGLNPFMYEICGSSSFDAEVCGTSRKMFRWKRGQLHGAQLRFITRLDMRAEAESFCRVSLLR